MIEHLVGDLQRIVAYPEKGSRSRSRCGRVLAAYQRLVQAGFAGRLLPG